MPALRPRWSAALAALILSTAAPWAVAAPLATFSATHVCPADAAFGCNDFVDDGVPFATPFLIEAPGLPGSRGDAVFAFNIHTRVTLSPAAQAELDAGGPGYSSSLSLSLSTPVDPVPAPESYFASFTASNAFQYGFPSGSANLFTVAVQGPDTVSEFIDLNPDATLQLITRRVELVFPFGQLAGTSYRLEASVFSQAATAGLSLTTEIEVLGFGPAAPPVTPVPEPSTVALLGLGLGALALGRRRRVGRAPA